MDNYLFISTLAKIVFVVAILLIYMLLVIWLERRFAAMLQDRLGPIRASIPLLGRNMKLKGILQPIADGVKSLWKEDFVPPKADKFLHALAPLMAVAPVAVAYSVIPFGSTFYPNHTLEVLPEPPTGRAIPLQIARLNFGILFLFAMGGTGAIAAAIAGYSSNNKFSLLGGMRAASQMVSYEVVLSLSLVGCFMVYNTLLIEEMVQWQIDNLWGIFTQPMAFILFLTCATAEMKRTPFDVPEAESEIVGGCFLEYSGLKYVLFKMGEYLELFLAATVMVCLFFGGHHLPGLNRYGIDLFGFQLPLWHGVVIALQTAVFLFKVVLIIWFQFLIRWTVPRFRTDQVMKLCWKYLLPLALINIFVTGVVIMALEPIS